MAACKIDGMLKVYFFFGEHGLVQFEQQQRDAHRNKPGKHPANGNLVKNDGIKGHDLTPMIKGIEPSPRQAAGNLHRKDENRFSVRSLTPPQAARNALAVAVQFPGQFPKRRDRCLRQQAGPTGDVAS
jgi:hypothetical protein